MELNKAIKTRHSVRHFRSERVDWRLLLEAIDAARVAPFAGNICTLRVILVHDPEKIAKLAEAAGQDFIAQAPYVVIFCSSNEQVKRAYGERGLMYSRQQIGAAIENFWLKLVDLGLATCWIGAFDDMAVKRILCIPDDIVVEALFPVGKEFGRGKQRSKPQLDNILYFEEWGNKRMKKPPSVEVP